MDHRLFPPPRPEPGCHCGQRGRKCDCEYDSGLQESRDEGIVDECMLSPSTLPSFN
jgi:hypothetical protein